MLIAEAQEIIALPYEKTEDIIWNNSEKEYYSKIWQTQVVTNVSKPTIQVFRPTKETNTGTSVIIAPGGALYAHSINSEGNDVAKWLTKKGITAFVLKYRLIPTGNDGVEEVTNLAQTNPQKINEEVSKVLPFSIQDGLNAIAYVRKNADLYNINTSKIGFMGFSAGGAVTMGVSHQYTKKNMPNFLVPIYAWTEVIKIQKPKKDVPPTLLICATDDPLGLAKGTIEIYESLRRANKSVALHMYAKGGHGFGMRTQNLPSDKWIDRFYEWAIAEELIQFK